MQFSLKKKSQALLFLLLILFVSACATKKHKDDLSPIGKVYENTTAKYNGYFNANVLLTESIAKLNDAHQDNYNQILELYPYRATDKPESVAGSLDEAIKKVSIVVSLHRESDWTDDCYLLLGKAQYVKQDFESAEETFLYMNQEFSPQAIEDKKSGKRKVKGKKSSSSKKKKSSSSKKKKKKKKKRKKKKRKKPGSKKKKKSSSSKSKSASKKTTDKASNKAKEVVKDEADEKPESYFLKHRPAHQEGRLWLARTYIERDDYDTAETIITELENDPQTFKDIKAELAVVRAHYHIVQKDYDRAVLPLEKAIELSKTRRDKARYAFILGQIHQEQGRGDQAYEYFNKALKYKPTYEMDFSSRLNMTQSAWKSGKSTDAEVAKSLTKMLKDEKNKEFKDQIYYALAGVALKAGDKKDAISNFKLSLAQNSQNQAQKAESYLQLANLYFEDEQFVFAKSYFDSTLQVLPESDERHTQITRYNNSLTDIAKNIQIIQLQDSLLAINDLSDKEKRQLAARIKKERDKAKNKGNAGAATINSSRPLVGGINRPSIGGGSTPSTFFVYNDRALKKGKRDFEKRWGTRKLEDNWRRSNRRGASDIDTSDEIVEEVSESVGDDELKEIFKDVPTTDEEIAKANQKIADAQLALGRLYREQLQRNDKTVDVLEDGMLKRFPKNKNELDAWYFLYLAHTDLNNASKAKIYFDQIVGEYPNTTYARVLKDPNFLEASKEEDQKLNRYYQETFISFEKGNYKSAADKIVKVDELFGQGNKLKPKFDLLNAMCTGNLQGKDAYISSLKEVIAKYPETEEQTRAKEILRLLGGKVASGLGDNKGNTGKFKTEDERVHYCIVVINQKSMKLTDAKAKVADYNRQFNKLDKLRISNIYLGADTETPILVIRRFKTKEIGMKYYDAISRNKDKFLGDNDSYEVFLVTQHNYRQILKDKSLDGYRGFFKDNYLN